MNDSRGFESRCPKCNESRPCGYCTDCDPEHFDHLAYHGDGWSFDRVEVRVKSSRLPGKMSYHFMIPKPLYDYIKNIAPLAFE